MVKMNTSSIFTIYLSVIIRIGIIFIIQHNIKTTFE